MSDLVERLARSIYAKRPDCQGKPWPLETEDQRRAYPHNPIAAVDLSFIYARAALSEIQAAGYAVVPREPTEKMWIDGQQAIIDRSDCDYINHRAACYAWVAMLASSPKVLP